MTSIASFSSPEPTILLDSAANRSAALSNRIVGYGDENGIAFNGEQGSQLIELSYPCLCFFQTGLNLLNKQAQTGFRVLGKVSAGVK